MPLSPDVVAAIQLRADRRCELCGADSDLSTCVIDGAPTQDADSGALLCGRCAAQTGPAAPLDPEHLRCLQTAAWSQDPPVQVLCLRLLSRLDEGWAADLLGELWVDDAVRTWAEQGTEAAETRPTVIDSNGTPLADGDSVTLIKDLAVKGGGFTAKRGTLVKNIRLGDDPTHIEGRVNKQAIMLKTVFLKKAN